MHVYIPEDVQKPFVVSINNNLIEGTWIHAKGSIAGGYPELKPANGKGHLGRDNVAFFGERETL